MNRYEIKRTNGNKAVGILNYDETAGTYTIDVPIGISSREAPFMLALFLKKGIRSLDQDASMRWVRSRIIPSSRQNIEEILEKNKMDSYDEHTLLLKSEGRSCQDEFYIEEIPTS